MHAVGFPIVPRISFVPPAFLVLCRSWSKGQPLLLLLQRPYAAEHEISTFFSQFGVVEEVNLFRERKTGKSKGCGFVTMQTRDQALKAIETMGGEPEVC